MAGLFVYYYLLASTKWQGYTRQKLPITLKIDVT